MSIDPNELKRHIRDALDERDRERERDEKDKARDARIGELEAALKAKPKADDHEAEPGDDHPFEA